MMKGACTTAAKESSMSRTSSRSTDDPMNPFRNLASVYKTSSSMCPLIHQVLGHPKIYSGFAELLYMENVKSVLNNDADAVYLRTLELFAFGSLDDYLASSEGHYLKLTETQLQKLKLLTLLSKISSHTDPYVPYSLLFRALHVDTMRDLEDLLMECIYNNLLTGKCDQRRRTFIRHSTTSRDVKLDQIPDFIHALQGWQSKTTNLLHLLQETGTHAADARNQYAESWKHVDNKISNIQRSKDLNRNAALSSALSSSMDIDLSAEHHHLPQRASALHSRDRKSMKRSRAAGHNSPGDFTYVMDKEDAAASTAANRRM